MSKLKTALSIVMVAAITGANLFLSKPQSVAAAPFICDSAFYQIISGDFAKLNPETGEYQNIGNLGSMATNAAGYNRVDNYIYAWQSETGLGGANGIIRIESDGSYTHLGVPSGLPVANYFAGDMDDGNNLYIYGGGNTLYRVDVLTNVATAVPLSSALVGADLVYINGILYMLNDTSLLAVNPISGIVTTIPVSTGQPNGTYGAGWASDGSKLFFSHNSSGVIVEVSGFTGSTPQINPVLQGESTTFNDGTSCALAKSPIPSLSAAPDENSTIINTPVSGNVLSNDQGSNITVTSYTQPENGTIFINPDGSYSYTPNSGFVGKDVFTYTITDEFGETRTTTVTITVVVVTTSTSASSELADTGGSQDLLTMLTIGTLMTSFVALMIAKRQTRSLI